MKTSILVLRRLSALLICISITALCLRALGGPSAASTIEFAKPTFTATENHRVTLITLVRSGSVRDLATVRFMARNGSATAGFDYIADSGPVVFQRGERTKFVKILIRRDQLVEGPETVLLTLSHPRNAVLGAQSSATLTIIDADSPPQFSCAGRLDDSFVPDPRLHLPHYSDRPVFVEVLRDGKVIAAGLGLGEGANLVRLNSDGSLDPGFSPASVPQVRDMAVQRDGRILISSAFGLGRFLADGSPDGTFEPSIDGTVDHVVAMRDGRIIISGSFAAVSGVARPGLARLNADGSLDSTFNPILASTTAGTPMVVTLIQVQRDAKVLIVEATDPSAYGTQQLRRLNSDGSRDAAFQPQTSSQIAAVAVQDDGRILVSALEFLDTSGNLLRLQPNGELDSSFASPYIAALSIFGANVIKPLPDNRVLIGGVSFVNGQAHNGVARLNANGSLDPTFNSDIRVVGYDDVQSITSIALQSDGRLIIAGDVAQVDGVERLGLARLFGKTDQCHGLVSLAATEYSVAENQANLMLQLVRNGSSRGAITVHYTLGLPWIYSHPPYVPATVGEDVIPASGSVTFADGETTKNIVLSIVNDSLIEATETFELALASTEGGAVLVEPRRADISILDDDSIGLTGQVDFSFNAPQDVFGWVIALAVQNGKLLVGSGGGIWRLNADGSIDSSFTPPANLRGVNSIAVQSDQRLVIDATFVSPDQPGQYRVLRLNPDGSVDPSFAPASPDGLVRSLALQPDGKILLGGNFRQVSGADRYGIARLLGNGVVDASFAPFGIDFSDDLKAVYAVGAQADGKVLMGGSFIYVNGVFHYPLARLNPDGSLDNTFTPELGGPLAALLVQPDGKILAGGKFYHGGTSTPPNGINRFNLNGTLDANFVGHVQIDNASNPDVLALAQQPDGKLLVGGVFRWVDALGSFAPGTFSPGIVRLLPDGAPDDTFFAGAGVDGAVNAIAVLPNGTLAIGGNFGHVNGYPRFGLALLHGDTSTRPGFIDVTPAFGYVSEGGINYVTVRRLWGSTGIVTVDYHTSDLTAVAGIDYAPQSGTITFADGDVTPKWIAIPSIDNDEISATFRDFAFTISNPGGGVRLANQTTVTRTVVEDEPGASFSYPDYKISKTAGQLTIDVYQIGDETFTVHYATVDDTAIAGVDYQPQSGTLTFTGYSRSFVIPIYNNPSAVGSRTFHLILPDPSLPNHAGSPATVTIVNE